MLSPLPAQRSSMRQPVHCEGAVPWTGSARVRRAGHRLPGDGKGSLQEKLIGRGKPRALFVAQATKTSLQTCMTLDFPRLLGHCYLFRGPKKEDWE